jgi:hypothetical protein
MKAAALGTMAFAVVMAMPLPALAFGTQSTYTDLSLDLCSVTKTNDFGTTWACPGYKGIPVMVAEGDLRFMVSYGLKSTEEPAAEQTLPPFNTIGPKIEWRLSNKEGRWKPFATILRYFVGEEGKPKGEVLVVTRLGEGSTCQIAYVDALANPNANELAQQAADAHGFDFDCKKDPTIVGKFGAWAK